MPRSERLGGILGPDTGGRRGITRHSEEQSSGKREDLFLFALSDGEEGEELLSGKGKSG